MKKYFITCTTTFILVFSLIFSGNIFGQSNASAQWPLTSSAAFSVVKSGLVDAKDESFRGTEVNQYSGPNSSQRIRLAGTNNTWPANLTSKIDTAFVQFEVMPKEGVTFNVTGISLGIGASSTSTMKAEIYYSTNEDFSNAVKVEFNTGISGNYLDRNNLTNVTASPGVMVESGNSFYLRIYPWHESASIASGKYMCLQDVIISGTTTGEATIYLPTLTTSTVSYISTASAVSGGYISNDGGGAVTERGVCWNMSGSPTTADAKTDDGTGSGSFVSVAAGLTPGTKYYLRAYAMNDAGTAYGNEVAFTTLDSISVPAVSTSSVSSILVKTAQGGGTVTSWGGDTITVRGVCWNTTGNPTVSDSKTENGSGLGSFNSILYPLEANTTYIVRAYATNSKGTGYGQVDTFKTQSPALKIVKTVAPDGSGDYTSVQAAFNDVPDYYTGPYYIKIKNGTYYEKLMLPASKTNVILLGEDRDKTILTYDDYAGKNNLGTSGSYSVSIDADDFTAFNITFQNTIVNDGTHPGSGEQAVALSVNGDRQQYYNCNLLGYQDTYYTRGSHGTGRTYMKNCYIEGSVDFIFGRNIVVFDSCEIHINRNSGTLTAASTDAESKFGYVFMNNKITADSIGFDGKPITSFVLGRPWQSSPRTVFINCEEPASLSPAGWSTWNVTPGLYAEFNCFGPGANPNGRLKSISRQLTDQEAADYTLHNIFSKDSNPNFGFDWMPDISTITSVERPQDGTVIPETFRLNQNYPNPFNPETTIKFSIPSVESLHPAIAGQVATFLQHVNLTVYDILGREVTTLINENKSPGNYEVKFNGAELSSGVYFYRIQAGDFVNSKKMILLK